MNTLFRIPSFMQRVVSVILLYATYIVGIGVVSVIGKLTQKSFLSQHPQRSSWSPYRNRQTDHAMY